MRRGAVGVRVLGSVRVSSCRFCMFVYCVHPVEILNAAFCITCSFLMLADDARGDHMTISKRHHIQAVEMSQTTVQIVWNPPTPSNGGPINCFC